MCCGIPSFASISDAICVSCRQMFRDTFVNNKGESCTRTDLAGKYIGIYFSAQWCGPCRAFTPQLVQTYQKLKASGKPFEIIFASSDRSKEEFDEYFGSMPWLTFGDNAESRTSGMSRHFEVDGAQTLVILDPELKTITTEGRSAVGDDAEGIEFPWIPKPFNPLNDAAVNDIPFLLVSTDGCGSALATAVGAITPTAQTEFAKAERVLNFFYVKDPQEDILEPVRRFANISADVALAIVDVQGNKKYIAADQSITAVNVASFVQAFLAGSLLSNPCRL